MIELSVIIAGRNEEFLAQTVKHVIENSGDKTEVIAICDGHKACPKVEEHPRIRLIELDVTIGQRAAINLGAKISNAKYIMKLDAHSAVDKDFDIKLMANCEPDWTVVPRMYNLHAYDWKCYGCGRKKYQGRSFTCCGDVKKKILWRAKKNTHNDFMLFDSKMQFGYWPKFRKRSEGKHDISDQLCALGACWFMERKRYWDLDGLDEAHGSWGQVGVEMACKAWLSGGKQVVNKNTWFAHMFRTGNFKGTGHNGSSFPYPLHSSDVAKAREHSRNLWLNNTWPKAIHPLSWLVERFSPVPGWND